MKTLKHLYEHQLKDLYSAEDQLTEAIPTLMEKATDTKLKNAFESHWQEAKNQKSKIESICNDMNINPEGEKCNAMEGLIKETQTFLNEDAEPDVRDAGLIADAQRIAHYEIAGYGTAKRFARELGNHNDADTLESICKNMYKLDEKLNDMAEERINKEAMA